MISIKGSYWYGDLWYSITDCSVWNCMKLILVLLWWRHQHDQMETFSVLLAIWAGNSPVTSPQKCQLCGALVFSMICAWINGWVNNREAGDLRRHRAHYDVIVMLMESETKSARDDMEDHHVADERWRCRMSFCLPIWVRFFLVNAIFLGILHV